MLAALLRNSFVTERPTANDSAVWRRDTRRHRLTLVMTAQGCAAIGLAVDGAVAPELGSVPANLPIDRKTDRNNTDVDRHSDVTSAPASMPAGKLGSVLSALATDHGATLAALVTLTGWLPHTTRAALCRLRQRGYSIQLVGDAGSRAYRLDIPAQG